MRCLILILFLLVVTAALTCSQVPVRLNGSEGLALLNSLTEGPLNQTDDSLNATNHSTNLSENKNTSSDFWSWGTRPKNYSLYSTGTDYLSDPAFNLWY
jgi:hypothetical protein